MDNFTLPVDLVKENLPDRVHIVAYQSSANLVKNRITMQSNLFSFLLSGTKNTYYAEKSVQIDNNQFLLLSSGNCLMSEKNAPEHGVYKAILFFFDNNILTDFFLKYPHILHGKVATIEREEPFIAFAHDDFLRNFLRSLELMLAGGRPISRDMRILKFEELMLYMADKYPGEILSLRTNNKEEHDFRHAVEAHIENNITVDELAFLCNMSTSTFKRRFAKVYGIAPSKWFLQKRMEIAATLLLNNREKPSDVYHKVGYENHSSFTQSFKQVYGLTPSEYQQQKLNVYQ
jgi:AraC-like DNA-binding protein